MFGKIEILSTAKMLVFGIGLIGLSSFADCAKKPVNDHGEEKQMRAKTIEQVLKEHTDEWMAIPGVVGTAMGEHQGKPCIKVLVVKKTEKLAEAFPAQVEGFPVIVEETGQFRARTSE